MLASHCRFVRRVCSRLCGTGLCDRSAVGSLAGQLFGDKDEVGNDSQPYTPHRTEAGALFQLFEIERFEEVEQDGQTALGKQKHWHLFHIVAVAVGVTRRW